MLDWPVYTAFAVAVVCSYLLVGKWMNQKHERSMLAAAERHDARQLHEPAARPKQQGSPVFDKMPHMVDGGPPTTECREAAFELIAHATNQNTPLFTMTVHDAHAEGRSLGAWEISARRID